MSGLLRRDKSSIGHPGKLAGVAGTQSTYHFMGAGIKKRRFHQNCTTWGELDLENSVVERKVAKFSVKTMTRCVESESGP